jgi:glutaredoxin
MKKVLMFSILILAVILVSGCTTPAPKQTGIGTDAAKTEMEKFIKDSGSTATIKAVTEEGDLYKVVINDGKQDYDTYLTKDGKKFFPQFMDVEETTKKIAESKQKEADKNKEIPKNDKPEVNLYVMSFCPYGNQAEDTLKPVYNLLKDKVDFNFHYIVTAEGDNIQSLHGEKEVSQDEREVCVLNQYGKDKWVDFVTYVNANCGSDGSCWEAGAESLAISTDKISSCVSSEGASLMKAEAGASNAAGATGSPTMVINGSETQTVYQYGNSEEYKKAICGAFNTAPAECSQELSSQTSTAEGGSCGS